MLKKCCLSEAEQSLHKAHSPSLLPIPLSDRLRLFSLNSEQRAPPTQGHDRLRLVTRAHANSENDGEARGGDPDDTTMLSADHRKATQENLNLDRFQRLILRTGMMLHPRLVLMTEMTLRMHPQSDDRTRNHTYPKQTATDS